MAPTDPLTDQLTACPYLGLPDDPRTRFSFATPAHRCHVERKPSPIDLDHQGNYCLSSDFPACGRLIARLAAIHAKAESAGTVDPAVVTAIPQVSSPISAPPVAAPPVASVPVAAPPVAPTPVAAPPVAASARDYSWPSAAREAVPSSGSTASPWATPWSETTLPVTAPPVSRPKRPWTAEVTPVKGARARLPQTAPLAARSRIRPASGRYRFGGRNLRRGALILLVVLALAAAVATGMLGRLLPVGLL